MNKNKKTTQLAVLVAAASLALGVVFMGDFLKGGKVALATNNKSLTFCDGTTSAVPFTLAANVGEVHGGMMTATTCTNTTGLQLGNERKALNDNTGTYDCIVVWDAQAIGDAVTCFVSAINITSVSVLAESTSYVDGTKNTLSFTGYPNSMSFTENSGVDYDSIVNTLGTGTPYTPAVSGTTVSVTGLSNVKTVAFKIVAIAYGAGSATAHFKSFTVNWAC